MLQVPPSSRFRYRLLEQSDAALLQELDSDPRVMKYINGGHAHTIDEIEQTYLPRLKAFTNGDKGWGLWGVFTNNDDDFLGWVLVRPYDFFGAFPDYNNLELGWRFKQATWGQGVGFEAANAVFDALKQAHAADKYCAIALKENIASVKIMRKLGMQYIDTRLYKDDLAEEVVVYYELRA